MMFREIKTISCFFIISVKKTEKAFRPGQTEKAPFGQSFYTHSFTFFAVIVRQSSFVSGTVFLFSSGVGTPPLIECPVYNIEKKYTYLSLIHHFYGEWTISCITKFFLPVYKGILLFRNCHDP
jgi:hypothetical protein